MAIFHCYVSSPEGTPNPHGVTKNKVAMAVLGTSHVWTWKIVTRRRVTPKLLRLQTPNTWSAARSCNSCCQFFRHKNTQDINLKTMCIHVPTGCGKLKFWPINTWWWKPQYINIYDSTDTEVRVFSWVIPGMEEWKAFLKFFQAT